MGRESASPLGHPHALGCWWVGREVKKGYLPGYQPGEGLCLYFTEEKEKGYSPTRNPWY